MPTTRPSSSSMWTTRTVRSTCRHAGRPGLPAASSTSWCSDDKRRDASRAAANSLESFRQGPGLLKACATPPRKRAREQIAFIEKHENKSADIEEVWKADELKKVRSSVKPRANSSRSSWWKKRENALAGHEHPQADAEDGLSAWDLRNRRQRGDRGVVEKVLATTRPNRRAGAYAETDVNFAASRAAARPGRMAMISRARASRAIGTDGR